MLRALADLERVVWDLRSRRICTKPYIQYTYKTESRVMASNGRWVTSMGEETNGKLRREAQWCEYAVQVF